MLRIGTPAVAAAFVLLLAPAVGAVDGSTTTTAESTTTTSESSTTTAETTTTTTEAPPSGGGLSITVPASASGGTVTVSAGQVTVPLGAVTVTDARTGELRSWTASVSATDFTTGSATAAETISSASVSYASGPTTGATGTVVPVPGQPDPAVLVPLSAPVTAFSSSGGSGETSVSWSPTVVIAFDAETVAGGYSGVITHSLA